MRVVYFGTGTFAVPALQAVAEHVVLVVAQPDRPSGRGLKLQPSPVKLAATELGLPVETPAKSRAPEFVERLQGLEADLLLVASYGQILSQAVLESARHGGINLHGSILPKYRGAAPIQRAILDGESETGVTLMQMDKGMDTGDEIEVVRTPIGSDETYGELQDRLAIIAAELARRRLPDLASGHYVRTPQDNERATIASKIDRGETQLDFSRPASGEYNRFRAFSPAPGTFVETKLGRLKVISARCSEAGGNPGGVLAVNPELTVSFAEGSLRLLEVQAEGKKRMAGRDWANGARLRAGESLLT